MSQDRKMQRLRQSGGCNACSHTAGPRLAASSLAGLVGSIAGRAAVPLILTLVREAGGHWDLSHTPLFPVIVSLSITHAGYWESQQTDAGQGLNFQLSPCFKKYFESHQ